MNTHKRTVLVSAIALVLIIGGLIWYGYVRDSGRNQALDYVAAYRLVPEKISSSAAIRVELPATASEQPVDVSKQVSFAPAISGHWLAAAEALGAAANGASPNAKVFYYKPDAALAVGSHYDVSLAMSGTDAMHVDFMAVADPEVSAILPHGDDEVATSTKISIVFNRPMIPLSGLGQYITKDIPVDIAPTGPGRFKWISTNTLQFIPDGGLISSAHYSVKVRDGFRSLDGIAAKPAAASFSTLHLRFWSDGSGSDGFDVSQNTDEVRGYNQPLLVKFNQPVDLDKTKAFVKVTDQTTGGGAVQYVLKYASAKSDAGVTEDQETLAIYPAGGTNGGWEPKHRYAVMVGSAYPKSGGDITIEDPSSFVFAIDDIYSSLTALSPRTSQASLDRFDPTGQLAVTFYEDIDLAQSSITGKYVDKAVYGETCQENMTTCVKVPDKKRILISFKADALHPGDAFEADLSSIVSSAGVKLTSKPLPIALSVYKPLEIFGIQADKYLDRVVICSNNPLDTKAKNGALTADTKFDIISWQESYLQNEYSDSSSCGAGKFETTVFGYLLGQTTYRAALTAVDAFGQSAQGAFAFDTREVNNRDYQLRSYQNSDIVTTPAKTKLSFAASYIPEITATVCSVSPNDFYRLHNNPNLDPKSLCAHIEQKTISLQNSKPGMREFSVDIKDYAPQAVGNYVVLLSSPLVTKNSDYSWNDFSKTFVSVTNLTVTEKRINPLAADNLDAARLTGDQLGTLQNVYWVIDATTQKPVSGASISLYKKGAAVETAVTDDKGLAFLKPVTDMDMSVASYGNDATVITGYSAQLSYADNAENVRKVYLYTDKPIYRPGQEVDLKGLYRLGYDGYYELPPTDPVTLTVQNSNGETAKSFVVTPDKFGTMHAAFTLLKTAPLGTYSACIKYQCASFDVLDYAPAAFKVSLKSAKDEYSVGEQPEVGVDAAYYFGVPVSNASVDYHVSSQYYHFDKYDKEYFNFNNLSDNTATEDYYYGDHYMGKGTATLDDNGHASLKPAIDPSKLTDPQLSKIIIIDATVKNQQGRSVSAQKSFILNAAPIYLGSNIDEPFMSASDPVQLKLKSVDTTGAVLSARMSAALYRVSWVNDGAGISQSASDWHRKRDLIKTFDATTDASGDGSIALPAQTAGQYEVDVTSQGSVGSRSWFYVYGDQNVAVRSNDDTSLELVPNNAHVKTGDTAEVLIKVPEGAGKALVTIERGKVFSYQVIDIAGTITRFKFPVTDQYYPNVYVSATVYSPNRSVRFGSYSFIVDSDQKKLDLTVKADKKLYGPGDPVTLQLSAKDEKGQPLIADVSIAVVDMSVLALSGNPKKDPLSTFYGHVPLTVETYSNFKSLLKQVANRAEDGKGGSGGDSNSKKSRGDFKEVALWQSDVVTDASGHATVKFTLPDNLTTWQAEAVGVTTDTHVGAAYDEFSTNKQLMVVPLKPRFILPGDRFSLGATVFNNSKADFNGTASLKADLLDVDHATLQKNVSIKAGSSQAIYWNVSVPYTMLPGTIDYSISANGSDLADAVDDSLIVNENSAYEVTATAGQTDATANEAVFVPPSSIPNQGSLTLRSSATLTVYLGSALKYMLDYPYDCTEQISSRIQVLAMMKNAGILADQSKKTSTDDLVKTGLQSIYDRQNSDGGFKLWPEDNQSDYWATLQAIKAFDSLQRSGYAIDATVWDNAVTYVYKTYSVHGDDLDAVDTTEALFTRPKYASQSDVLQLFSKAATYYINNPKASTGRLIELSQIMHRRGISPDLAAKADLMLENRLVVDSRGSFLDIGPTESYPDTAISNTARYISLLSERQQSSVELPNLVRWLVRSRSRDGAWGSTINTAAAVGAITDYAQSQHELSATFTLDNSVNGASVDHADITPGTIMAQLTKTIPLADLHPNVLNSVSFAKTAVKGADTGKIYYDMSLKYYLPANTLGPRDEGFAIQRGFYALSDKDSANPLAKAKVGDVIREHVEITVPATRNQVALEDFIPAGTEIVDTSLATEDKSLDQVQTTVKNPQLWPNHQEWRDDRAFLYFDQLEPGTYQFDYLVRALVPGTYSQLPANISEIYTPENFGRSGANLFTIEQ